MALVPGTPQASSGKRGAGKEVEREMTNKRISLSHSFLSPQVGRAGHVPHHAGSQQGIWSTMKHLMRSQGGHSHGHAGPHSAMSHAHVYTLAGGGPPNVVDMTGPGGAREGGGRRRPWSRSSRAARGATLGDITSGGMIRSAASVALDGPAAPGEGAAGRLAGVGRLWRGVQTMFVGCVPAHALYFSSYEAVKSLSLTPSSGGGGGHVGHDTLSSSQAALAGGVATLLHDLVMTPMDTVKQRMQLGHYESMGHAFSSIVRGDGAGGAAAGEGWTGLYRSLPVTVMTNLPYGMIMMTTNEWLRAAIEDGLYGPGAPGGGDGERPFHFATVLLSGMGAGTAASAATAPLDRIKTRLQTQRMGMAGGGGAGPSRDGRAAAILEERAAAAARGERTVCPRVAVADARRALAGLEPPAGPAAAPTAPPAAAPRAHYAGVREALASILAEEGPRGLFRGALPRVALHAPSVAISWTAYEAAKGWLLWAR